MQSFYGWHFLLFDLVHEAPRSFVFWYNFLNSIIKENTFGLLDEFLEILPVLSYLEESVLDQFLVAILVLPHFEVFSDIDILWKFVLDSIWDSCIFLNNCLKRFFAWYIWNTNIANSVHELRNNFFSSLLFFIIAHLLSWINSSSIDMSTVKRAWSDRLLDFGRIKWILILFYSCWRNIKLITELASCGLSAYWVKTWLIGNKSFKSKESVTSNQMSLKAEWWGYERSYSLFLILKSSVITRILAERAGH